MLKQIIDLCMERCSLISASIQVLYLLIVFVAVLRLYATYLFMSFLFEVNYFTMKKVCLFVF